RGGAARPRSPARRSRRSARRASIREGLRRAGRPRARALFRCRLRPWALGAALSAEDLARPSLARSRPPASRGGPEDQRRSRLGRTACARGRGGRGGETVLPLLSSSRPAAGAAAGSLLLCTGGPPRGGGTAARIQRSRPARRAGGWRADRLARAPGGRRFHRRGRVRSRAPPRPLARAAREGEGRRALPACGESAPRAVAPGARSALEKALDARGRPPRSVAGGARSHLGAHSFGAVVLGDGAAALRRMSLPVPAPGHPPSRAAR